MIKRLFKKSTPIRLRRWGVTYEASVLEKRINWANHDHCGDIICKDPKIVKNLIEKNKLLKKKN